MGEESHRKPSNRDFRTHDMRLVIDPGFVNRRRIETVVGDAGTKIIDTMIGRLSPGPEWQEEARVDKIYMRVLLEYCSINKVKTLESVLIDNCDSLFCSTLELAPCREFYDVDRAVSVWVPSFEFGKPVEFHYTTKRVRADTLRGRLHSGALISIVGLLYKEEDNRIIFDPLLMGFPWLETDVPEWEHAAMWSSTEFFQNYLEDFDEFAKVADFPLPEDFSAMQQVPEAGFKRALARLLTDETTKDWGGEASDHFTTHLHLAGRRVNGAFLLKGPASFRPMTIRHLGKNGDQIARLSDEPADVLFVQHCHEITPAVLKMLRAFAAQPGQPRRYCAIDGRESLRLLHAYDLYDFACAVP